MKLKIRRCTPNISPSTWCSVYQCSFTLLTPLFNISQACVLNVEIEIARVRLWKYSVLVEADGRVQYRRNVTHVNYLERDNVPQAISKSSDTTEAVTPSSRSLELRETVKDPPGMRSGENLLERKSSNDATTWQSHSTSRFQDYIIGCVQLVPE